VAWLDREMWLFVVSAIMVLAVVAILVLGEC
jgi:hypothetical protein